MATCRESEIKRSTRSGPNLDPRRSQPFFVKKIVGEDTGCEMGKWRIHLCVVPLFGTLREPSGALARHGGAVQSLGILKEEMLQIHKTIFWRNFKLLTLQNNKHSPSPLSVPGKLQPPTFKWT